MSSVEELLEQGRDVVYRGDYQEAVIIYEEILRIDPENREAKIGLRNSYEKLGSVFIESL